METATNSPVSPIKPEDIRPVSEKSAKPSRVRKQKVSAETSIILSKKDEAIELGKIVDEFILGSSINKKLSPTQISLCKKTAITFGLNPLKREIHFVPRMTYENSRPTGKYDVTIVIGYEVYLKRAEATKKLNGWGVTFEGVGENLKALLTIHRIDWAHPFSHEVFANEAKQNSPVWNKMPKFMLRKTVISQGFRLCFPEELAGLPYIPEELGIGVIEGGEFKEEKPKLPPPPIPATPAQVKTIHAFLAQKGKDKQTLYDHFKVDSLNKLTYQQADVSIKKLISLPDAVKNPMQELQETAERETKPGSEDVNPEEAEKGIDDMKLSEGGVQP